MNYRSVLMLAVVLGLLVVSCAPTTEAPPTTSAAPTQGTTTGAGAEESIRIGVSLPLTGFFSVPGEFHRNGFQLCMEMINDNGGLLGRPIEMLVEDNRSDTETAVIQYERFVSLEQVDLLFGTFSSLLTFPTSVIAERAEMVYLSPSDGTLGSFSRGFQYLFDVQQAPRQLIGQTPIDALFAYREAGIIPEDEFPTTAAVVHADDFFTNLIATGLLGGTVEIEGTDEVIDLTPGFLEEAGIEVVFAETWPVPFDNWVGLADRIQNADADFLLGLATGGPEGLDLVRALQTVGYNPRALYMSTGTEAEFSEQLGSAADGVMVHTAWHPAAEWEGNFLGGPFGNDEFIEAFQEAFGRDPNEDEAIPFSACQLLEQAVRAVGSTDNPAIRDWLASRTADDPAQTILGDFYWDDRGLVVDRHFLLTQWQEAELEFIFPRDEFAGVTDMLWPKPSP
jgi:branched-chain amino acid transport system substrate-binding protein